MDVVISSLRRPTFAVSTTLGGSADAGAADLLAGPNGAIVDGALGRIGCR